MAGCALVPYSFLVYELYTVVLFRLTFYLKLFREEINANFQL